MTAGCIASPEWEGRPLSHWREALRVPEFLACDVVSSTNDVIRQMAIDGAAAGSVCIADHQTAGRGQHGRTWTDRPGQALLLSLLLRPAPVTAELAPGAVPLRVGMAVARALRAVSGLDLCVKWPNDIVLPPAQVPGTADVSANPSPDDRVPRKVAGVLCEAVNAGAADGFVTVGIGINVFQSDDAWPDQLRSRATSLAAAAPGIDLSRCAVLTAVIQALRPLWHAPMSKLTAAELSTFAGFDVLRSHPIEVVSGNDVLRTGTADGILADGALSMYDAHGHAEVRNGSVRFAPVHSPLPGT